MMRFLNPARTLVVASAVLLSTVAAHAEKIKFMAMLDGAHETPATTSTGTGMVMATLDTDTHAFSYTVTYKGLTGAAVAAHFHGPAAEGSKAGPIIMVDAPLDSPIKSEVVLTPTQEKALVDGMVYFNIHTKANGGGEIRGQLKKQ